MTQQAAVNVELRMTVRDGGATPALEKVGQAGEQAAGKIGQASERAAAAIEQSAAAINKAADAISQMAQRSAQAQVQAADQAASAIEQTATRQRTAYERMSHAREVLGVRSEQSIQREIDQTTAAYQRVQREGNLSADEQARHYAALQQRVQTLTNEMGRLTAEQQRSADISARAGQAEQRRMQRQAEFMAQQERFQARMRTAVTVGAAVTAGAYTLKAPLQQAMSFDERLAGMANTAYAERDVVGRKIGMGQLEAAINRSVGKGGGGTRERAADALDMLIASGIVSPKDAMAMLPSIMRASAASGAEATELAGIGLRAQQTFKIAPADMPRILNMALAAGQAGGFELKDMARWLPQQMAAASLTGLSGRAGFARLVALNQVAATTAGTTDEAGNNVINLLAKINSADTARDAKKQLNVDLPAYLAQQRAKGVDAIDAFGALVEQSAMKRQDYREARAKLAGPQTDQAKRATLESMANIAQGAGIGTLIQDRQAMMALVAVLNQRQYLADVTAKVRANDRASGGAVDVNYALISGTAAFRVRQAEQAKDAAQKSAMDGLTPAVGKVAGVFADLAQKYPALSGAVYTATGAIAAMAAAAGGAALVLGGGKIPGTLGKLGRAGKVVAPVAGKAIKFAGRAVPHLAAAGVGWEIGEWAADKADIGGRVWEVFNGDKQTALKRAEAELAALRAKNHPEMKADVTISVTDDRVQVTRARLATKGVDATMNTGNVHTGAPR